MNMSKKIAASMAIAVASFSSSASLINVGGVVWDPESPLDFQGTTGAIYQIIATDGSLSGYGSVATLNGAGPTSFCPGCELTFQFGGFTPSSIDIATSKTNYKDGWVKFYVDNTPDASPTDPLALTDLNTGSESGINPLWLDLSGAIIFGTETTLNAGVDTLGTSAGGSGALEVTGGIAQNNFDTNAMIMGSDITFSSTFGLPVTAGTLTYSTGSANFNGESIPEPTSLAIFGLALLTFGASTRKRLL
jgi:hypothetical protein